MTKTAQSTDLTSCRNASINPSQDPIENNSGYCSSCSPTWRNSSKNSNASWLHHGKTDLLGPAARARSVPGTPAREKPQSSSGLAPTAPQLMTPSMPSSLINKRNLRSPIQPPSACSQLETHNQSPGVPSDQCPTQLNPTQPNSPTLDLLPSHCPKHPQSKVSLIKMLKSPFLYLTGLTRSLSKITMSSSQSSTGKIPASTTTILNGPTTPASQPTNKSISVGSNRAPRIHSALHSHLDNNTKTPNLVNALIQLQITPEQPSKTQPGHNLPLARISGNPEQLHAQILPSPLHKELKSLKSHQPQLPTSLSSSPAVLPMMANSPNLSTRSTKSSILFSPSPSFVQSSETSAMAVQLILKTRMNSLSGKRQSSGSYHQRAPVSRSPSFRVSNFSMSVMTGQRKTSPPTSFGSASTTPKSTTLIQTTTSARNLQCFSLIAVAEIPELGPSEATASDGPIGCIPYSY